MASVMGNQGINSRDYANVHATEIVICMINGRNSKSITFHVSKQNDGHLFSMINSLMIETIGTVVKVEEN